MQTLSNPVIPTKLYLATLASFDEAFEQLKGTDVKAPQEVWNFLLMDAKKPDSEREVNGCGSKSTEVIPDTMYGLCVTPICHIHDATHKLSRTPEDCDLSNQLLLTNLTKYIDKNSLPVIAWLRRYRAMTYYSAVHSARHQFCPGYKNEKNL